MPRANYSVLDPALEIVLRSGPEIRGGLSNHAPMAAEAMCAMGRATAVMPWLDAYRKLLLPRPSPREAITNRNWRAALGKQDRIGDWIAFFEREVDQRAWHDTLGRWLPRLAPGISAAAMHGVIRTGHAVRALANEETPSRRLELAQGLAYWAAEFQHLPERAKAPTDSPEIPSRAILRAPIYPPERRGHGFRSITDALAQLDGFEPFESAASMSAVGRDASAFLSDLTATFVRVYLANAHDIPTTIALIHAVTGPSAMRPMLPYISHESAAMAGRYLWQASAALYAIFATTPGTAMATSMAFDENDLSDRAIASGDEHAIKFTEVCIREHALNPRPEYIAAADHAITILRRG